MPKRRRKSAPYAGKLSCSVTPAVARRRLRSWVTSLPKFREMLGAGQRAFGHRIKAFGLATRILESEYLRERDRLLIALVAEFAEQYRIAAVIAQRDGARAHAGIAAPGLEVSEHIGTQRALARVGAGRLVVLDLVGRDQQRRQRIDASRLAGADIPLSEWSRIP